MSGPKRSNQMEGYMDKEIPFELQPLRGFRVRGEVDYSRISYFIYLYGHSLIYFELNKK